HLLSRSAAAPLLVTLLASRWLHTDRPEPATNLLLLLAIPPVLSLTRGLVPKQARTPILLVIGLLILKIFGGALTSGTLAGRWLLLLGSAVGLTTIGWFIRVRRGRPRQRLGGIGFWRVLGVFLPVAGALFATAIVADVLGFAALGGYLASGTVLSLWMAVVFYLGALVLSSLFVFISHRDPVRSLRVVQGRGAGLERFAGRLFHLAAILMWARATLFAFDLWGPVTDRLVGLTTQEWEVGAVTISASDILSLLGIFLGSLILARLVRILLDEEIFPRMTLPRGVPGALSMLSRYFIVAFGILLGLSAAGIDLSSFGLAAGALGLGLGFGLQDVIGNFVSGLILAVERPIQKGDTVEVGNLLGRVSEIGVRSSKVQTFEGAEVIVPNGSLLSKELINWTLSDERRRLDIAVRVAYGTDPHHVVELLEGVAAVHPEVLQDPPPRALFDGFGDTSLDFRLQCWVPFGKGVVAKSDLALGIHDALKEAGISIPVPRRRIVSSEDP
ncbi:MAG: mechanosensitive ion channel, partial [Thermoanaerobaculia bacterium]|nr:mechanosensitive ion channel [Thermoanaerobaculia bacterium]